MGAGALRYAWRWLVGLGMVVFAAVAAMPVLPARAQQASGPATYPMTVTMNRVPGATGQVTITPLGNNQIRVEINITGLPPSPSARAAHIHTAPGAMCDNNAPVTYPLNDVMIDSSGHGTSTTTVTLTPDKPVEANNAYVNVHEESSPPGPGVICANITQSYTAGGTSAPATGAAPSGTPAMMTTAAVPTGACVPHDSWCAYCSANPAAAACKAFVPPHASGTTATGAMSNSNDQLVPGVDQGLPPVPIPVEGPLPLIAVPLP
jgi:hypothetical protein